MNIKTYPHARGARSHHGALSGEALQLGSIEHCGHVTQARARGHSSFAKRAVLLVLVAMILAAMPVAAFARQAPDVLPKIEYQAAYEFNLAAEERIFEMVNDLRQNPGKYSLDNGKSVASIHAKTHILYRSAVIKRVSRYKSLHMAAYNDFNHEYTCGPLAGVGRNGTSELVFFDTVYWAENIAYRSTTATYSGIEFGELLFYQWLNSPGHLSAMMSPRVSYIGVGVAAIRKNAVVYVYGTQQFSCDNPATSKLVPNPLTSGGNESSIIGNTSSTTYSSSWVKSGSDWFLLRNGSVQTGWQKVSGKWYFMDKATGAMATGWLKDGDHWYYTNGSGAMQTGWKMISGRWYFLRSSGVMVTGWFYNGGKWYYLLSNGAMATGWLNLGDKWYYLDPVSGAMATGMRVIDGAVHNFTSAGVWLG